MIGLFDSNTPPRKEVSSSTPQFISTNSGRHGFDLSGREGTLRQSRIPWLPTELPSLSPKNFTGRSITVLPLLRIPDLYCIVLLCRCSHRHPQHPPDSRKSNPLTLSFSADLVPLAPQTCRPSLDTLNFGFSSPADTADHPHIPKALTLKGKSVGLEDFGERSFHDSMLLFSLAIPSTPSKNEFVYDDPRETRSPEIPESLFEPLLLRRGASITRLRIAILYLRTRHARANNLNYPSIFSGEITSTSFTAKYYNLPSSLSYRDLKRDIETKAHQDRRSKLVELQRLNASFDHLMARSNAFSCSFQTQYYRNEITGRQESKVVHSTGCEKCGLKRQAEALNIQIFEWPLLSNPSEAEGAVVELNPPKVLRVWRDTTYSLMHNEFLQSRVSFDGPRPECMGKYKDSRAFDWSLRSSFTALPDIPRGRHVPLPSQSSHPPHWELLQRLNALTPQRRFTLKGFKGIQSVIWNSLPPSAQHFGFAEACREILEFAGKLEIFATDGSATGATSSNSETCSELSNRAAARLSPYYSSEFWTLSPDREYQSRAEVTGSEMEQVICRNSRIITSPLYHNQREPGDETLLDAIGQWPDMHGTDLVKAATLTYSRDWTSQPLPHVFLSLYN
ncbi:hypothetical protein V5O48_016972, partial [Marasmius crinis-equi]